MAKTLSFTAMHFGVAFSVAYALTGDVAIGGAVALAEPAVNSVAYYFHERFWAKRERRSVSKSNHSRGETNLSSSPYAMLFSASRS
ncbi:MAG TPA: DUF2061 domain-containing protein [Marinobacterium sp.]|nr:DUF2061 domain-containing protein [Marinobacterium sp.]